VVARSLGRNDKLFGGAHGKDLLEGGAGLDTLIGGLGLETFLLDVASGTRSDVITDFLAWRGAAP
jgi:serralysin